jgi:C-terminal processing protease CtpA/Prc
MGFLDKAKEKATQLAEQAKEKVDDLKDKRKADDLLDDLGRIVFRQRTGRGEDGDDATITALVAQLQALEAEGTPVLTQKDTAATSTESSFPPPSAPLDTPSTPSTPNDPPASASGGYPSPE